MVTRPLRSDAARNRERVLAAASELFAARGLSVSVPEIAERAGVGKATVYRGFPTKDALVAAVLEQRLTWFAQRTEQAIAEIDAAAALRALLNEFADLDAGDLGLADAIALALEPPELEAQLRAVNDALDLLVERGQAQGGLRPDASGADLRLHLNAVARSLAAAGEHDAAVWRHHFALVADAWAAHARG